MLELLRKLLNDEIRSRSKKNVVKANVTIDWTIKQSARARLRVLVKSILRKYGYPPNLEEDAANLVPQQAELLAQDWAEE